MLYLGVMFLLTVLFLPRGFAGFIMMHQVAWVRGTIKQLALPYLLTGIPALLVMLSAVALIEMSHVEADVLQFIGFTLEPALLTDWLMVGIVGTGSLFAVRKSLPRLRDAWDSANTIPSEGGS
jgi:branched-chain amino acid transport system permease protein